jgi:formate dehydrogenase major subunit
LNFLCSGSPSEIFDEFASLTHACHTFTSDRLGSTGKLWPHPDSERDDGSVVLFEQGFPTPNGRAKFVPADWTAAPELPDEACPLVLNTGRLLEHWHMGSMTCRAKVLDAIEPEALIHVHPDDARDRRRGRGPDRQPVRSRHLQGAPLLARPAWCCVPALPLSQGRRRPADDRRTRLRR